MRKDLFTHTVVIPISRKFIASVSTISKALMSDIDIDKYRL